MTYTRSSECINALIKKDKFFTVEKMEGRIFFPFITNGVENRGEYKNEDNSSSRSIIRRRKRIYYSNKNRHLGRLRRVENKVA